MSSRTRNPFRLTKPRPRLFQARAVTCRICEDFVTEDDLAHQHASCTACFHRGCLGDELDKHQVLHGNDSAFACPFCDNEMIISQRKRRRLALGREAYHLNKEMPARIETEICKCDTDGLFRWATAVSYARRHVVEQQEVIGRMDLTSDAAVALLKERTDALVLEIIQFAKDCHVEESMTETFMFYVKSTMEMLKLLAELDFNDALAELEDQAAQADPQEQEDDVENSGSQENEV